jgi:Fe-S-cluster-containing dehydrogenase component
MTEESSTKWGMVVDQDLCIGCQVCVTACSIENNVPFTSEEETAYGRGMHWIRIQRYWQGKYPDVTAEFTPVMCQQCGHAPCEPVCPVFASAHSASESINLQVYNRCIGTRYCANNCPYISRTFNWFDYQMPAPMTFYLNPDVTVRSRGVMEKCTFCVQRIVQGERKAREQGRAVMDGEIQPACVQACPTNALVFGLLVDENSQVYQKARSQRRYTLLEELGADPKVVYLKGGGYYGG